ncbi:MAG TPA: hypothetical protein VMV19_19410 [Xanthobacteraceae bacterium]|nr:hypothetical protein [Xanthobacteraceae bacterium]
MAQVSITLPTLHVDQVAAFEKRSRFYAVRCGRRWGKSTFAEVLAADGAIRRQKIGLFGPDYRRTSPLYRALKQILAPLIDSKSKTDGEIILRTGGLCDFWTLQDEDAGRSRAYHKVIIDEGAFTDNKTMMDIWEKSIKPTLLDYSGSAYVLSNTNGVDLENFFWRICNQPEHGFTEYHAPTRNNPLLPLRQIDEDETAYQTRRAAIFTDLKKQTHPLVYEQEYEAKFVDWSGDAFFDLGKLLGADGNPLPYPATCDAVFAVIDSATKTGKENDGTAVVYFARTREAISPIPLTILDYDIAQIEGSLLETWLPSVFAKLEGFAKTCRARAGSLGVWIEDKSSGMVLLQQAKRRGWRAHPIESKLTALGKSERAIDVSGYVFGGKVKLSAYAHDKVTPYKGVSRNHLLGQVLGFRPGSKEAVDDDLLDCFSYGLALGLGNAAGF